MDGFKDTISVALWVKKHWQKRLTIFLLILGLIVLGLWLSYRLDLSVVLQCITVLEFVGIFVPAGVLWIVWFLTTRSPRVRKGMIGIAVAIDCETEREKSRLKADFVRALKEEIQKGYHQRLDLIELSEYHSEKIRYSGDVARYHKSTGAHLLIFGSCKTREHQGKSVYVLEMDVSVAHAPVSQEVRARLGSEMVQLFPKPRLFPVDDEVAGFAVTKEVVGHGARYVLGVASLLSGDVRKAFDLHHGLWKEMNEKIEIEPGPYPWYQIIRVALPRKLVVEGLHLANSVYRAKQGDYLKEMGEYLSVVQEIDPRSYGAHLMRGIWYFLRDLVDEAKKEIRKAKNDKDAAWQYSDAFLRAYEGDLEQAHRVYQRAFRGVTKPDIPLDVEMFISDVLEREPDKVQFWYCLGMLNYFGKEDFGAAFRDFSRFVEKAEERRIFDVSVQHAKQYLEEIRGKLEERSG